jgi:hypothetical protein
MKIPESNSDSHLAITRHFVNLCAAESSCRSSDAIAVLMIANGLIPSFDDEIVRILDRIVVARGMTQEAYLLIDKSVALQKAKASCSQSIASVCKGMGEISRSIYPDDWKVTPALKKRTQELLETFN